MLEFAKQGGQRVYVGIRYPGGSQNLCGNLLLKGVTGSMWEFPTQVGHRVHAGICYPSGSQSHCGNLLLR